MHVSTYKALSFPLSLSLSLSLSQLLIAYEHNYLELWDALTWKPQSIFGPFNEDGIGDLLTSCWHSGGSQFLTTHQSGAIAFWNPDEPARPVKVTHLHGESACLHMYMCMYMCSTCTFMLHACTSTAQCL